MAHTSVLLNEALEHLALKEGDTVVDGTLGSAGHALLIAQAIGKSGVLIGIDHDEEALARSKVQLKGAASSIHLQQGNFADLSQILSSVSIDSIDKLFLDLGLNSEQLENSNRGFSFKKNEPLKMTFSSDSTKHPFTAETIVNEWEEGSIEDILRGYGEERFARSIAQKIVEHRKESPIKTTDDLVAVVKEAVPAWYRFKKIHPATKTFQALRIAVNDEIQSLKRGLLDAYEHLNEGGRIVVISFHSIEDRVVKHTFHEWEKEKCGIRITKKPLIPTEEEIKDNPRSRSAKLRTFEKHESSKQKEEE